MASIRGDYPGGEIELLSTMLESLVQLLEQKGVLTQAEWEITIKKRVTVN